MTTTSTVLIIRYSRYTIFSKTSFCCKIESEGAFTSDSSNCLNYFHFHFFAFTHFVPFYRKFAIFYLFFVSHFCVQIFEYYFLFFCNSEKDDAFSQMEQKIDNPRYVEYIRYFVIRNQSKQFVYWRALLDRKQ